VDADPRNILEPLTVGGYLCSDPVATYYILLRMTRLARGRTPMITKRLVVRILSVCHIRCHIHIRCVSSATSALWQNG